MRYKPKTSSEINQFQIERIIKKLKGGAILSRDENEMLNRRFKRLKKDNPIWYDDLHGKYTAMMTKKTLTY